MDELDVARGRDTERRAEIDRIGVRVKAERTARSWSLRRLATESGLSASLLSAVENGRIVPTVGSLFAISDALGVSAPALFPPSRQSRPAEGSGDDPDARSDDRVGSTGPSSDVGGDEPTRASAERSAADAAARGSVPGPRPTVPAVDAPPVAGRAPTRRPGRGLIARPVRRASGGSFARRASPGETPAAVSDSGPGAAHRPSNTSDAVDRSEAVSGDASDEPRRTEDSRPMPGVAVLAADARRRIPLPDGSVWTLIHREPGDAVVILEGRLSPGAMVPAVFTVRAGVTRVVVQRGRLRLESGFREVELQDGAEVAVEAGVPFRISAARAVGPDPDDATSTEATTILVILEGGWDGRLL